MLRRVHRHGGAIAALARAIRRDDADEADGILRAGDAGDSNVQWIATDADEAIPTDGLGDVRRLAVDAGRTVIESARAGNARARPSTRWGASGCCAVTAAARRASPRGWTTLRTGSRSEVEGFTTGTDWYVGRPLIVTENDYGLTSTTVTPAW